MECGPLLLASVGNSPKLERIDFSPVLSAMIMAILQTTAPSLRLLLKISFCFTLHSVVDFLLHLGVCLDWYYSECRKQYNAFETDWAALHCTFKQCREVLHLVISRIIFISRWNYQFWKKYPREINLFNSFLICQQYHKCQMRWGLIVSKSGISMTFVNCVTIKTCLQRFDLKVTFSRLPSWTSCWEEASLLGCPSRNQSEMGKQYS